MGAEIWIAGIYVLTAFAAVRFLLPIDFRKTPFRQKIVLILLLLLLFPMWLPFSAWRKWRAIRERQIYLSLAEDYFDVSEQVVVGRESISSLIEKLAVFPDKGNQNSDTEVLESLLASRLNEDVRLRTQILPSLYERARTIYFRNRVYFELDDTLPKLEQTIEVDERLSPLFYDANAVSQLRLSFEIRNGKLSVGERGRILDRLRDHLVGPPLIKHEMRNRYMRRTARFRQGDVTSEAWTLEFSSSFRKSIKRAGRAIQEKTNDAIAELLINPMTPKGDTIARLNNDKSGMWRYRFGDYRLIYIPVPEQKQLIFITLAHRSEAYH